MTNLLKSLLLIALFLAPGAARGVMIKTDLGRVIKTDKVAHIDRDFDAQLDFMFAREMQTTENLPGPRVIIIDSNGGSDIVGQHVISRIEKEQAQGIEVVCVVKDKAHSMGFNTLTRCSTRLTVTGSMMVVHKMRYPGLPPDRPLTARILRLYAKELDISDEPYRQANSKAMRLSLKEYDYFADRETAWPAMELVLRGYFQGFATLSEK